MNPLLRKAKFYIIKSVFDENVDISQEKGVWATLPHNEKKFNTAFCVSIFIVKAGPNANFFSSYVEKWIHLVRKWPPAKFQSDDVIMGSTEVKLVKF